jgi:HlyD family secretion protein
MTGTELDIDALIRGRRRPWRRLAVLGGLLGVIAAAAGTYVLVRGQETLTVVAPTEAQATLGQLSTAIDLTGAAAAARYEALAFGAAGEIASVEVAVGEAVEAGQVLARLDPAFLALAVHEAELDLATRQADLSDTVSGPSDLATASRIASAQQSVLTATARVSAAEDALEALVNPSSADVAAAEAAMLDAQAALEEAEEHLAVLRDGPSATALSSADLAVANAQSRLITAADAVVRAQNDDGVARTLAEIVTGESTATADQIATLILQKPKDPLVSGVALTAAEADYLAGKAQLEAAIAGRAELLAPPTSTSLATARNAVTVTEDAYDDARVTAERLAAAWRAVNLGQTVPPDDDSARLARVDLEAAAAGLRAANADLADLLTGPEASAVSSAQLAVVRAERNLLEAQAALEAATLVAPFAGTLQSVSIAAGDAVTVSTVALELLDEAAIEVELTVTESDLPSIDVGQVGLATFDAVDGQEYPVRVDRISRVPDAAAAFPAAARSPVRVPVAVACSPASSCRRA